MPDIMSLNNPHPRAHIIKFTNCLLAKDNDLIPGDLLINATTGKIIDGQKAFYEERLRPHEIIDLQGRILAPGFIDVQINGAYGLDFSIVPEDGGISKYRKGLAMVNKKLLQTGVTSYLPTLTTQPSAVYHEVLPELGPTGHLRNPELGAESLGVHCEGPFLSPSHKGCHDPSLMLNPTHGIVDVGDCYGWDNLKYGRIKMVTIAPELDGALDAIRDLKKCSSEIRIAIGHSGASYEEAKRAVRAGASMITHLYNAMKPFEHRAPGIFGLISGTPSSYHPSARPPSRSSSQSSTSSSSSTSTSTSSQDSAPPPIQSLPLSPPAKPHFGLIADTHHVHPCALNTAFLTHSTGAILVTDAMFPLGLPDGVYPWHTTTSVSPSSPSYSGPSTTTTTTTSHIIKTAATLHLASTGALAGSTATMLDCVRNFVACTDASVGEAIGAATGAPAEMLGLQGRKGALRVGADADLVVLRWNGHVGREVELRVEEVWKFGGRVWVGGKGPEVDG